MKDILITGGAGKIGYDLTLKLANSDYSITVLDLKSKESSKKLEKLSNKIKIVYGDVEDSNLIRDLVKKNDIVIDYAGIMPPFANINESIANNTNFLGCKNIVDAIKEVNPSCKYIYMSFVSIYGTTDNKIKRLTVGGKTENPDDYYSISIIRSEDYIKSNLKKYAIYRMPIVLTKNNYYVKHIKLNKVMDFITVDDLNNIVIKSIGTKQIYGKIFNISGFKANSTVLLKNIYKYTGELKSLSRVLYYGEFDDCDDIHEYISYKCKNANDYYKSLVDNNNSIIVKIKKIINLPEYLIFINKKRNK